MPIRIVLADDHSLLRAGLRALLQSDADLQVVGEAGDGYQALEMARALHPDVLLMDVSMPGLGGIEATRQLAQSQPATRVLILTVHEDATMLQAALEAGAAGYIVKRALETELSSAIRAVARGDVYVHPSVTRALLTVRSPAGARATPAPQTLTPREQEVLSLIAHGHTNRQIADLLTLSVRTVETHRANIMGKLGLESRVELVRYASEHGMLDRPTA